MRFALLLVVGLFFACGPAALVDYEKGLNWEPEKTYSYYTEMNSGLIEADEMSVKNAIDSLMVSKGFKKVNDSLSHYHIGYFAEEVIEVPATIDNYGVMLEGVDGPKELPSAANKVLQRLTIEVRDATFAEQLLWQGIHEGQYKIKASTKEKDIYYKDCISEMLETFPPQQ